MGGNTSVPNIIGDILSGGMTAAPNAGLIATGNKGVGDAVADLIPKPVTPPDLKTPATATVPTPTVQQASTTAIQNQLANEKVAYSTSAFLTGGQGLLDEPTVTSRVLLGS